MRNSALGGIFTSGRRPQGFSSTLLKVPNNTRPIPVFIIHGKIGPFTHQCQLDKCGEFYMDETVDKNFRVPLKIEAGFYSSNLVWYLVNELNTPTTNIKWEITTKKSLKLDTFRNFLTSILDMFPEAQAKLMANAFVGELGRKYSRIDHRFTCRDMDT